MRFSTSILNTYHNQERAIDMLRPKPAQVTPLDNYKLSLVFDNGEHKIFDVKPLINGEWFGELQDMSIFKTVKIADNTVEWINGQDVCPDDLYYLSKVVAI